MSASTSPPPALTVDTSATAPASSTSNAATPAPFPIKVGRGGAGNIYNEAELSQTQAARRVDDVEAQRSIDNDLTVDEADARERLNNTHRPPPDYAHSGRGGAGNWFSPREEIEKQGQQEGQEMKPMEKDRPGKTSSPSTPSSSTSSTTSPTMGRREIKFRPGGRGGAGNIEYGRQIQEQRRREAERAANKNQGKKDVEISQQVVVDVEAGLTPPPKARLGKDRLRSEL